MEELKAYIQETLPELKELIVELCGIPAPSHHEEKRAEFCRDWLLRNGASPEQVRIDEALNVVCEVPGETDEIDRVHGAYRYGVPGPGASALP